LSMLLHGSADAIAGRHRKTVFLTATSMTPKRELVCRSVKARH
jgi:hypothetical protein